MLPEALRKAGTDCSGGTDGTFFASESPEPSTEQGPHEGVVRVCWGKGLGRGAQKPHWGSSGRRAGLLCQEAGRLRRPDHCRKYFQDYGSVVC